MELRHKVMSALRWTAAARVLGQLFSWFITIYVIRLLSPADYGLMAMAMVVISLLILVNTLGLDAVLVQEKELTEPLRRAVFGQVILVNCAFFLLVFFGAEPLAGFYGEPAVEPVLKVLAFQFLLLIFETLPQSQLERELAFSRRAVVDFTTAIVGSLTTLVLAMNGQGVWALVWGTVLTNALRMIGLNLICRNLVWPSFSLAPLRAHFAFGGFVSADRTLWYLFTESDKFVGGKLLGSVSLGYYAVANQLAALPINKISGLLNSVAFPAFSQTHKEEGNEKVRDYLRKSTRLLAIAAFPVCFGMSATAEPLIACLLGEKWLPAAPLLALLAAVLPLRLLSNVFPPLLWGIGMPRTSAGNFLFAAIFMPIAFLLGAQFGAIGLAYAWLLAYPVVFLVNARRVCRAIELDLVTYLKELLPAAVSATVMALAVAGLGHFAELAPDQWTTLAILVLEGVVTYMVAILILDRAHVAELVSLIRA